MPTPSWTDDHARLVAAAAPDVPDATDGELERTWAAIRPGLSPDRPRRRRVRLVIGAGVAAVLLAGAGVATAEVLTARTGRYASDAEDLRLGGPGERLDQGAPDFGAVVAEITRDIPFPSEAERQRAIERQVEDGRRGHSLVSTGALRFFVARDAVCTWGNAWAAAEDSGSREQARAALEAAPAWPAVTDLDPDQVIRYRDGLPDNTEAGYFPLLRDAAVDHDLAELGRVLVRWGACLPDFVPDFPRAMPASLRER